MKFAVYKLVNSPQTNRGERVSEVFNTYKEAMVECLNLTERLDGILTVAEVKDEPV
jgi:hypothetical protein